MSPARFLSLAPLQIAQALIGFGAIAAFTRLMSAEDFGRYALALSISMAAHTLAFTWAESAAFRFFAAARAEKRLADHFATLLVLAMTLGLIVITITATVLAFVGLRDDIAALSLFAAGAAVMRFITRIGRESDRAALAFGRYAVLETIYLTVGFAVGVALLIMFDFGAAAPFAGLLAAGALVALVDLPRLMRHARGGEPSVQRATAYAGYGTPLALALAVDLGVQAIARLILAGEAGTAPLGAYAAAFGLARALDIVFMGVSAAFAPLVFAAYEERGAGAAREAARGGFILLAVITVPASVGLALLAQPVATLMVGEALRAETAATLPWLALAGLMSGFGLYYWSEAFQLTRRTGQRALLMLAPGAVQLALTAWLSQTHGAVGAAIGASVGASIGAALLAAAGRRLLPLPLPLNDITRIAIATAAMAALVVAFPAPHTTLGLFQSATLGAIAYGVAAAALNIMGVRDLAPAVVRAALRRNHTMTSSANAD
ncbi:MAG: lipopolysaccharide biosynthesis protein [Hyphomonadaceae bacterium]|nr:lipopolysaccharide biosynthesis protein [Hyphomonadaceae bacterium]